MLVTDVDTIVCDDCFDVSVYKDDTAIVLNEVELKELHEALNEWVAENNIVRVELVAHRLKALWRKPMRRYFSKILKFKDDNGKLQSMVVTYEIQKDLTVRMTPESWEEYLKVKRCENG